MDTGGEHSDQQMKQSRWGFRGMTVRDWLELLIVPLALVVISFIFTAQQDQRQQQIEDQRAEQVTLQEYLDQMGTLLLDRDLHDTKKDSDVRRLARARTLIVLDALESSDRKRRALRFLYETELIQAKPSDEPVLSLSHASLRNFESSTTHLLKGAKLTQATLSGAELPKADLVGTDLSGVQLDGANLSGANLSHAKLCSASLNDDTDLSGAILIGADFSDDQGLWNRGARMSGADLDGANLSRADLTNAEVTKKQLEQARSLEGAT